MPLRYDVSRAELQALLDAIGAPRYRAEQVWRGLHERFVDIDDMTDLPKPLRRHLAAALPPALALERTSVSDAGTTVKWLWRLVDEERVLARRLPGYTDYQRQVPYRLLPRIW